MKIYIVHADLLEQFDKSFYEMTDEEVVALCESDTERQYHDCFESIEALSGAWNTEEVFSPYCSYMRVIND